MRMASSSPINVAVAPSKLVAAVGVSGLVHMAAGPFELLHAAMGPASPNHELEGPLLTDGPTATWKVDERSHGGTES